MSAAAPIAVIGMHRSGTSCLAGCLEDCGLFLGEVNRAAPHNRKGNNENERFRDVHDAILARVGATWDAPPAAPVAWTAAEKAAMRALIADYDDTPRWGFKDPRSLFLLDGWFELVPDLALVGTFRHPAETAASLSARNGWPAERGLALWAAYNRALLAWRERIAFPVVFYDADADRYLAEVRGAAAALGLQADADIAFRDEGLNHHAAAAPPPADYAGLWDRLHAARLRP